MQYGVCCGPSMAPALAEAGYDFFEWTVGAALRPRDPEPTFRETLAQIRAAPVPCLALNCFIPGDLRITGPTADLRALEQFVEVACRRAEEAGVKAIVFGSGGARRIPDGFERAAALGQIVDFCRMLGPIAGRHGVTIVVEPLNKGECNVLVTVAESADVVRRADHPAIRLLVDAYHWMKDGDSAADVAANGPLLAHVHVATLAKHMAPGVEECDFGPFFRSLKQGGYDGRISIEAGLPNPPADLPRALTVLRALAK
jgi:sugar phosphate isomerase/epimerase